MNCKGHQTSFTIPPLRYIALRGFVLSLYESTARWRKAKDIKQDGFDCIKRLKVALHVKKQVLSAFNGILLEVERWDNKHSKMFFEENIRSNGPKLPKNRVCRSEHLKMFHQSLVWKKYHFAVDDYLSALNIMKKDCYDWPQMRFQFACCYAMEKVLEDNIKFSPVRRKVFRQSIGSHCVYDMWLRVLADKKEWKRMFMDDRIFVNQVCVQAIHFAMKNGFLELTEYLWRKLTPPQKEAIGFLAWKSVCIRLNCTEILRFLCDQLCEINLNGMVILTWDSFYAKVIKSLETEDRNSDEYEQNLGKLELFLSNICPKLKKALLSRNDCRAITDAFWYQNHEVFGIFLEHTTPEKLANARELVDRIYDHKKTMSMKRMRSNLLHKQNTIV